MSSADISYLGITGSRSLPAGSTPSATAPAKLCSSKAGWLRPLAWR
jgi:hypothetical protein